MKNILANKFLFTVFLSFAALNCTSTASNVAVNVNTANANSVAAVTENINKGDAAVAVAETAPDALVAELYKQHDGQNSPFFQTENRAAVDKYFTKSTADIIWEYAVEANGEVGGLGALRFTTRRIRTSKTSKSVSLSSPAIKRKSRSRLIISEKTSY